MKTIPPKRGTCQWDCGAFPCRNASVSYRPDTGKQFCPWHTIDVEDDGMYVEYFEPIIARVSLPQYIARLPRMWFLTRKALVGHVSSPGRMAFRITLSRLEIKLRKRYCAK